LNSISKKNRVVLALGLRRKGVQNASVWRVWKVCAYPLAALRVLGALDHLWRWLQPAKSSNLLKRLRFTLDVIGEKALRRIDFSLTKWNLPNPTSRYESFLCEFDLCEGIEILWQDMKDMTTCYDSLLSASAAATTNIAYEFPESLLEMGNCLLKKTAMHDDGKSSK
ncbi:hydroxyproline-rich glycoprotein family protein, partial [Striga asiatica]